MKSDLKNSKQAASGEKKENPSRPQVAGGRGASVLPALTDSALLYPADVWNVPHAGPKKTVGSLCRLMGSENVYLSAPLSFHMLVLCVYL